MKRAEYSVDLPLAAATAFAEWEQIERFPTFMRHVVRVARIDDLRSYWELKIGGIEWDFEVVVTARQPGRYLEWVTENGDVVFTGSVYFTALDAATTRARVLIEWQPRGLIEKVGAAFGDDSRVIREELENFRIHLATQTPSVGPL